jgi:hypothetical protein|tara:strand:+ start:549 stop:818 length:270 start_codon:yes stop_codon:yes gene_type:complete
MSNNEYDEWFKDIVNGEPKEAEMWQLSYIESVLYHTSISTQEQERIHSELNSYSELEAEEIIKYLKENEIKRDPKHQYEQMRKNGMFDD